jgi:hypothetical protein
MYEELFEERGKENMKKFAGLVIAFLLLVTFASGVDKRMEDQSGLFSIEVQGMWGFINAEGEVVIKPLYDSVGFFSEGLAQARLDGKWGYIDTSGKMIIPPAFTYADYFTEGLAVVGEGAGLGYIDRKGNWAIPAQFDEAMAFRQGRARVRRMHQWGFIDNKGKVVIPFQYEDAYDFSEDVAAVKCGDEWGYIDRSGGYIFDDRFESTYEFREGWAEVGIDGTQNFINKKGRYLSDGTDYLAAQNFFDGLAAVQSIQNGKYGYIDKSGKFVIPAQYDIIFPFNEGLAAVSRSGKYGFIDKKGKEVIPLQYEFTEVFIGGLAYMKDKDGWLYIDKKGRTVWPKKKSEADSAVESIEVYYDMADLTQIIMKNGRLIYMDSEYRGKNKTVAETPDDYARKSRETSISEKEIKSLLEIINNSGFFGLKDSYGITPGDRHYPATIGFKVQGMERSVLYRSNPDFPAPHSFQEVEAVLIKNARKKFE